MRAHVDKKYKNIKTFMNIEKLSKIIFFQNFVILKKKKTVIINISKLKSTIFNNEQFSLTFSYFILHN